MISRDECTLSFWRSHLRTNTCTKVQPVVTKIPKWREEPVTTRVKNTNNTEQNRKDRSCSCSPRRKSKPFRMTCYFVVPRKRSDIRQQKTCLFFKHTRDATYWIQKFDLFIINLNLWYQVVVYHEPKLFLRKRPLIISLIIIVFHSRMKRSSFPAMHNLHRTGVWTHHHHAFPCAHLL